MKKIFLYTALLLLLLTFSSAEAKSITVNVKSAAAPQVTVTELPFFGRRTLSYGPHLYVFRCTNHTLVPIKLELDVHPSYSRNSKFKILREVTVPAAGSCDAVMPIPCMERMHFFLTYGAFAGNGVKVKKSSLPIGTSSSGVISSSFKPDMREYLFRDFQKSPLPVKEWPKDTRSYAGLPNVILDSADVLSSEVFQALRLAAARGTRVTVLVMGDAPWPAYAGKEIPGKAFSEKIGFGCWSVMRSQAVESDPAWKNFVKRKHAALKKGRYSRENRNLKWKENLQFNVNPKNLSNPLIAQVSVAQPPIPIGMLCGLMVIFVIIIGPVNYMVLKKRRLEIWALVTIPLLSIAFSGAVILSVMYKDGFRSRGKGMAETVLDQTTGLMVTRGGFGIYSAIPVDKFRFSVDDLVTFQNPGAVYGTFEGEESVFANTLLRSRMSLSYGVTRAEYRSEKIAVSVKKGVIEAVNGLGVKVDSLYLCDSKGRFFKLPSPLAPGARGVLVPIPKLPATEKSLEKNWCRAQVSEPLFIKPGVIPDDYEHRQTILVRWR